ncbi:hypothetical protein [Nakamurella leprariae]|uniref:Uncharacterized protein n=1 Tax=Nakamurella leprariae TaxID=2803911 RepID=A0A938Y7G2_9ACTN|nr:hypothetical protein [Nakamurella leprariae]MBM9467220.1 hypothetical protein [Nakamurella leprariae]
MSSGLAPSALVERARNVLYGVEPDAFLVERTALVRAARAAGDRPAARAIGALRRPTRSADAVNRLARRQPASLEQLLEVGDQLRAAYRTADAAAMRELTRRRRTLLPRLVTAAGALVGDPDPSAAFRDEVTATLSAALADPDAAATVRRGVVSRPLLWDAFAEQALGQDEATVGGGTESDGEARTPAPDARPSLVDLLAAAVASRPSPPGRAPGERRDPAEEDPDDVANDLDRRDISGDAEDKDAGHDDDHDHDPGSAVAPPTPRRLAPFGPAIARRPVRSGVRPAPSPDPSPRAAGRPRPERPSADPRAAGPDAGPDGAAPRSVSALRRSTEDLAVAAAAAVAARRAAEEAEATARERARAVLADADAAVGIASADLMETQDRVRVVQELLTDAHRRVDDARLAVRRARLDRAKAIELARSLGIEVTDPDATAPAESADHDVSAD